MIALVMLAVMAGCVAFLYLKGTLVQGVTMVFNALLGALIALGLHELLAGLLIQYAANIAAWAPMICFLLLFILAFALLQTAAVQLGKGKADLGKLPEQIGRVVSGIVLGYVVTGCLLVAVAMAPLPPEYPYPRFDTRRPNPAEPSKPLLSPDGFITGLAGTVSKGSFASLGSPRSFALLRAGYLDQLYLNRIAVGKGVPLRTKDDVLVPPEDNEVWYAPESLLDSDGQPVRGRPGERLVLARVRIKARSLREAGKFTLSQIRLVCRRRGGSSKPLAGQGRALYPVGYVGEGKRLETKPLHEVITVTADDVKGKALIMDTAFHVPTDLTPVLLQFKLNNVVRVPAPVSGEEAPSMVALGGAAAPASPPRPPASAGRQAEAPSAPSSQQDSGRDSGLSDISRGIIGDQLEDN
jgi:hypothetical protein